ncbi:MAG TPA: hypothetical protein VI142_06140 [Gaiellaceae bacterium]
MKFFPGRRRIGLAVVVTAALAGLAGGLVFAHEHSSAALAQGPPRVVAQGKFRSLTWSTLGTASLVREPSGDLRLRLSSGFMTKRAPELFVYLAKLRGQQRVFWKEVGDLKRSEGAQEYDVGSEAAQPGVQVAIYCGKCNQISGLAPLEPVGSSS